MLRDITLGQYYQTESVVHRLDPRVKLMATVIFIISLFVVNNFWGYLLAAGFLALVIRLSHVPFKFMVKGMKAILLLLILTVVFNLLEYLYFSRPVAFHHFVIQDSSLNQHP